MYCLLITAKGRCILNRTVGTNDNNLFMHERLHRNHAMFLFRFGRKKTVIVHSILGGIACVVVSLIPVGTNRTGTERSYRY